MRIETTSRYHFNCPGCGTDHLFDELHTDDCRPSVKGPGWWRCSYCLVRFDVLAYSNNSIALERSPEQTFQLPPGSVLELLLQIEGPDYYLVGKPKDDAKVVIIESDRAQVRAAALQSFIEHSKLPMADGCPCLLVGPCEPSCTCVDATKSGGCRRCARYGSTEQRLGMAQYIDKLLRDGFDLDRHRRDVVEEVVLKLLTHRILRRDREEWMPLLAEIRDKYLPTGARLQDAVPEASLQYCAACAADGDTVKKLCRYREDTGLPPDWLCDECYAEWKKTP